MLERKYSNLLFCNVGGECTNAGRAGHEITVYGKDVGSHPHPKVVFCGSAGDTYAKIVNSRQESIVFKVPELGRPGWYKIKIQTRLGWSKAQQFFYC